MSDNLSDVESSLRAAAALDDITSAAREWRRTHRRPRAFTARDALIVLQFEAVLVGVAAGNVAYGIELSEADRDRLLLAVSRIHAIVDEATG